MYNELAYIYDDLMDDVDYKKWYSYILELISRNNISPKDILEMACGTGKLSYYFLEDGYNMTCFDISEDMLTVAENKLRGYKNLRLLQSDMAEYSHENSYDLIISNCDSVNYIVEDEDIENTFLNAKKNLKKDGIFIFDINSKYKLENILGNNTYVEDRDDVFYTWENYLYSEEKIVEFFLNFFIKGDNGDYRRFTEEHIERIYSIDEILYYLKKVGFKTVDYFESFTLKKPTEKSERITFVSVNES